MEPAVDWNFSSGVNVFLFIFIALWPLTFFKHGYDGYHEASLVNSCAFGDDIAESTSSGFASCLWNHNPLILRIACGKGYFSLRINYHSRSVWGFHLICLFTSGDVYLNPGPDNYGNSGWETTVVYVHLVPFHLSTAWLDIINLVQEVVYFIGLRHLLRMDSLQLCFSMNFLFCLSV